MLKQVLLVLSCCALVTVRASQPCLGVPLDVPHSFAASPESCDAYVICMNGQTIHGQRCPAGMYFEPRTQHCGQSSCLDCSPFGIQNLPHPDSCNQFIECVMGTRSIRTCPNDLLFDRSVEVGHCNYPHLVNCPGQPGPTPDPWDPTTPNPWDPTTPNPWDPTTPNPWDPTTPNPWDPTTPNPWDPTTPSPQYPVCAGNPQVHHAHPTDCTRFFMCVNNVLWPGQCPSDLHWNQLRNTCDRPETAGCINPTQPTGPPGTDPPLFPPESTTWQTFNPMDAQVGENDSEPESAPEEALIL